MRAQDSTLTTAVLVLTRSPMLSELRDLLHLEGFATLAMDSASSLDDLGDGTQFGLVVADESLTAVEAKRLVEHPRRARQYAILRVIQDGAGPQRDWLPRGAVTVEVVTSPGTAQELAFRVKAQLLRMGYPLPPSGAPVRTPPRRGSVTAVFSLKGGVGKSTIAVNLAVGLATEAGSRVLLIDADLVAGDVGVLLDLKGQYTLSDVCVRQVYDRDSLARMVVPHSSGVSVLLRPTDLNDLTYLDTSPIPEILPACREMYDHIIINMSPSVEEMNARLLDNADRILVIMTPEMPSIHATRRLLDLAGPLGYLSKMSLVVNRATSGIDVASVQHSFDVPIAARIVSDGRQVVRAANEGTSLFVLDPRKKQEITRNFAQLVDSVLGRKRKSAATRIRPRFVPRWLAA
jgi:Flp pilus assembly CpaE family ATPase